MRRRCRLFRWRLACASLFILFLFYCITLLSSKYWEYQDRLLIPDLEEFWKYFRSRQQQHHNIKGVAGDDRWSDADLEKIYYVYVDHVNHDDQIVRFCETSNIRFGGNGEGSWLVCKLPISEDCLVYSFGIGYDWRFEDEISSTFTCKLRAFDPSIPFDDHDRSPRIAFYKVGLSGDDLDSVAANWHMHTLQQFLERFNETQRLVDVLKVDIELAEWSALYKALNDGSLQRVKQLMLEIHTSELFGTSTHRDSFIFYLEVLFALDQAGFVKWRSETNTEGVQYHSRRTHRSRPCCAQLYYVNRNYSNLQLPTHL